MEETDKMEEVKETEEMEEVKYIFIYGDDKNELTPRKGKRSTLSPNFSGTDQLAPKQIHFFDGKNLHHLQTPFYLLGVCFSRS